MGALWVLVFFVILFLVAWGIDYGTGGLISDYFRDLVDSVKNDQ